MKFSLLFLTLGTLIYASCEKTLGSRIAPDNISGRWQIVVDSSGQGVGTGNHLVAYHGQEGDYYNFGSDSVLTVKESDSLFTYDYAIISDSSLALYTADDQFHIWPIAYSIIDPTTHTVTLINAWRYTPGGIFGRAVYLKR